MMLALTIGLLLAVVIAFALNFIVSNIVNEKSVPTGDFNKELNVR